MIKKLPDKQKMWVRSLGWEDPLEKEMATHSSGLTGKPHGQSSLGVIIQEVTKEWDMA